MKLEKAFLHSKLARRIFWLFVLCALLPVVALALISLRNVGAQLTEQSQRELRQTSRETGMSIYERLDFVDANMKMLAGSIRNSQDRAAQGIWDESNKAVSGLARQFDGLEVVTPDGKYRSILGKLPVAVDYSNQERDTIEAGHNVLATLNCGKVLPCVYLSEAVNPDDVSQGILVGQIRAPYLWDAENIPHPMTICVLNAAAE